MGELADYLVQHDANFRKARLPALYSDFRPQKMLNPDGYRANVSAWRGALSRLASHGLLSRHGSAPSVLVLELDDSLLRSLENRQFGQPLALGTAIREAVAGRHLVPLHDFLHSLQTVYRRSWSELPWNAVGWTLRQLGITGPGGGEDRLPKGRYVVMDNVEAAGNALAQKTAGNTSRFSRVFAKSQFQAEMSSSLLGDQRLSEIDVDVLLKFLARDRGMIEYDGQTMRLRHAGEQSRGITEEDGAIAAIKELTASLKHQIDLLNARIDQLGQEAKNAVARKNRVAAQAALKSRKLAESSLSRRYATLDQLETVAAKIEQASDQVQLVNMMESSAGVLRNLNAKVGGADRVDSVVDQLRDQMNDTDEVAAILAESTGVTVDEAEIDDELEALEKQERLMEEEAQRREKEMQAEAEVAKAHAALANLPLVPAETVPDGEKSLTPTSETGIAHLSLEKPM